MNTLGNPVELLNDGQVRSYFLGILQTGMTDEEKYQKFIDFFEMDRQMRERLRPHAGELLSGNKDDVDRAISQVSQQMGIWKPQERLAEVEDSIRRVLRHLSNSQKLDKGWWQWDDRPENGDFWDTGYVVLCLGAAKKFDEFASADVERMIGDGLGWIEKHRWEWSVADFPSNRLEVYRIALAIRCCYQAGKGRVSAETLAAIEQCVARLLGMQNKDGGWHAYTDALKDRYSEVGATSAALQAFGATHDLRYKPAVDRAVEWLLATQNKDAQNRDGSWNQGSCHYDPDNASMDTLAGEPVVSKTCDALQGLLVARDDFGVDLTPYQGAITKAVTWVQSREGPIFEDQDRQKIEGWGWSSHEDTSLTLETLVRMPDASLPLLSSNAQWLIKTQCRKEGSIEDGNWQFGHTARITLSLIQYYKELKDSPVSSSAQ
jgi:hypothetical protein